MRELRVVSEGEWTYQTAAWRSVLPEPDVIIEEGSTMSVVSRLTDAMTAAALPVVGCAILTVGQVPDPAWLVLTRAGGVFRARLDVSRPLTPAERATAQATLDTFDVIPRRPRTISAIMADINALSALDRSKLAIADQAARIQQNPDFARALGIAIDGDEPAVAAAPLPRLQSRPVKG